jgi:hypothetical protein
MDESSSSAAEPPAARWAEAYPAELRSREDELRRARRQTVDAVAPTNAEAQIGIAVSGGGIRSATFALGFFQALARTKVLRHTDYLSTVSGGSYFGAFFGGLFSPRDGKPTRIDRIEDLLRDPVSPPNAWLRENGRYLAPAGGGDVLSAGAGYLRSLVAVHVLQGALLLALFLAAFELRAALMFPLEQRFFCWSIHGLWPSPWLVLPAVILVVCCIPLGWAFWLMPGQSSGARNLLTWVTIPVAVVVPWFSWWGDWWWTSLFFTTTGVCALAWALGALSCYPARSSSGVGRVARGRLTTWLSWSLLAAATSLAFAVSDTVGQSLYAYLNAPGSRPWSLWTTAPPVALFSILPAIVRWLFARMGSRDGSKIALPVSIIAGVAAILIVAAHLTAVATFAHGVGYQFSPPTNDPAPAMVECIESGVCQTPPIAMLNRTSGFAAVLILATVLATSLLLGRSFSFLNLSTFQALYAGRITRAYLGASNPRRTDGARSLSDPVPGDDIALAEYRPHLNGGPLHLINVTMNETLSGETQTEYRDRKGLGLAIGPAGLSAGVKHHALWAFADKGQGERSNGAAATVRGFLGDESAPTPICPVPQGQKGFRLFDGYKGAPCVETLPVGSWVGISGAAVSTGLGYRTSLALSILAGFFNIRLGYWWDSYTRPWLRKEATETRGLFDPNRLAAWLFPTQTYLLDEWLARFRGSSRRLWNLTDGGHFENTAGYELVRRRVPLIVMLDDGEDPDWRFEDLGNFVRKVRLDFGAQVEFLRPGSDAPLPDWISWLLGPGARGAIVPLEELKARASEGRGNGVPLSKGYAALATVTYVDPPRVSWLLLVKPTLRGDEPIDLLQYKLQHGAFPQEPTTEQFFNEPQWESYRKLGEHIGRSLFYTS